MNKTIIAIGGGELRNKTTLYIDEYVSKLAKEHAGDKRANGLFIGTASHDSMPYFNTFRKTYTSIFDIKADCALTVYGEMNNEKLVEKFNRADFLYIGGGDTVFMLNHWKNSGLDKLVLDAYNRGVIVVGLSAGAIFHFETMYTDSNINVDNSCNYSLYPAMGTLKGVCCPHYNERINDFDKVLLNNNFEKAYAIENDCALKFENEHLIGSICEKAKAYCITNNGFNLIKTEIEHI